MAALKRSQLKVGKIIQPDGFPPGRIMTIENCTLESFIDGKKKKRWPCWTVRTDAARPLHKYLICDLGKDGIVLWKKSTIKFAPKGAKLWVERSGLEEMWCQVARRFAFLSAGDSRHKKPGSTQCPCCGCELFL